MRPAFLGVSIARSAIQAHQQAIDLTGQNIANASVDGYSRRKIHLSGAPSLPGETVNAPGSIGTGVQADLIQRIRDQFLDREYRLHKEQEQFHDTQAEYTQRVEAFLGELEGSSVGDVMDRFFDAWQELSVRPDDLGIREVVAEAGNDLASTFRNFTQDVQELQTDIQSDLQATIGRINELSQLIAGLNDQIADRVNAGDVPGDMLDQRDRHLDELSGLANIKVVQNKNGSVNVLIDNREIVHEDAANAIKMTEAVDFIRGTNPIDTTGLLLSNGDLVINGVDIIGSAAPTAIGSTGALLDLINQKSAQTGVTAEADPSGRLLLRASSTASQFIDVKVTGTGLTITGTPSGTFTVTNNTTLQIGKSNFLNQVGGRTQALMETKTRSIPDVLSQINQLALTVIERVNSIHGNAFDLNGNTGRPFFTGTNAGDIAVGTSILSDPSLIAIAGSAAFPPGDGSQALAISNVRFSKIGQNTVEDFYNAVVSGMGIKISQSLEQTNKQEMILEQLQNQRESVAGVNLDEEIANMLQFQRSFTAATRVMNAMDEMLNQIVSGLGLVGR